jgi:hypothetical protein
MRYTLVAFAGLSAWAVLAAAAAADITNYETAGNLKPSHVLGCIAMDEVKNVYTPPDLMAARTQCYKEGRIEGALELFLTAGAYARYDTQRVTDRSSHGAFQVLIMNSMPDSETQAKAKLAIAKYTAPNSPELASFCKAIKRLGPPDYYPAYMIQHGMGAFFGGAAKGGLVADFDSAKAWKLTVDKYLHCDVSDM